MCDTVFTIAEQAQPQTQVTSSTSEPELVQTHIHSTNPVKNLLHATSSYMVSIGMSTYIGGSKNRYGNQDTGDAFVIDPDKMAFLIADGHGTFGKEISISVTEFIKSQLTTRKDELVTDDGARLVFIGICVQSEQLIKETFPDSGGTTLTLVVTVANLLYTIQIGDSDAYIITPEPILSELEHIEYCFDAIDSELTKPTDETKKSILKISKCPCFEDRKEYDRIKASNGRVAFDGSECDIYETGELGTGSYYKTVKKEWAIYMSIPFGKNRLSMSRSLGDFNVKDYGASFMPVISCVNLNKISGIICIFLASDGVHDNWIEDHIQKFLMDKSCLSVVTSTPDDGAFKVSESFKNRNATYGNKNFGQTQDNATNCVVYLLPK